MLDLFSMIQKDLMEKMEQIEIEEFTGELIEVIETNVRVKNNPEIKELFIKSLKESKPRILVVQGEVYIENIEKECFDKIDVSLLLKNILVLCTGISKDKYFIAELEERVVGEILSKITKFELQNTRRVDLKELIMFIETMC